ncbi:MAG: inositol monophosphatase family protein [Chromatiales bacterium]
MSDPATLQVAIAAVQRACAVTRSVQERLESRHALRKADRSPVTIADYAAQAVIARSLLSNLDMEGCVLVAEENTEMLRAPEHAGLRQELVQTLEPVWPGVGEDDVLAAIDVAGPPCAEGFWTLDPIDGTRGFLRGGQYAVSLAYVREGRVELGVLGCPNLSADWQRPFDDADPVGLILYAIRGAGCWSVPAGVRSAAPERLQHTRPAGAGLRICESAESGHSDHTASVRATTALGGAEIKRLDSQAKYAVVARGQADAYVRIPRGADYAECIWDHAAGMLVATEAGACVTDIQGKNLDFSAGSRLSRNQGILCAGTHWHARLLDALNSDFEAQDRH